MITARDVAQELGLAISTVGRAMADDPRISSATKANVRRVAQRLGYVGNTPARIMRGGSSKMIGLMIPDVANDFYASIAQSLSDCVDRHGYRLVLALTRDDRDVEARQIAELVGARAAGIILVPTSRPKRESGTLLRGVPHVQLLRKVPSIGDVWFGIDDEAAMFAATSHLVESGHRRIGYIGGTEAFSTGASRVQGYRSALARAGIGLSEQLECLGQPLAAFGESAIRQLFALKPRPTAILTGSVHITLGVIVEIERQGIAVPDTLSLIGFGGPPWFEWWRGGVTAVRPPVDDLATSCGSWFLESIGSKGRAASAYSAVINSHLILRRSVKSL